MTARGLRNNNPGNIRPGSPFEGIAGIDNDQPTPPYLKFVDPQHGIRAICKILMTYHNRYGLSTIQSIFAKWAPALDHNDPSGYAAFVAKLVGVDQNATLTSDQLLSQKALVGFTKAISEMECGQGPFDGYPYPDGVYQEGVALALS